MNGSGGLLAGGREVVVSRKAGEAVLRGAQPYVPGCIAASAGLEAGDLVAVSGAVGGVLLSQ